MRSKMQLTTKLGQQLLMNQQLNQVIALLQYTTLELKQQINTILETNPLLELIEENEADEDISWQHNQNAIIRNQRTNDSINDDYLENIALTDSLRDHLLRQTLHCHFDEPEQLIAEAIIDAIDDDGYLMMTSEEILTAIQDNNSIHLDRVESVLSIIQRFDPPGVAARNTQECLMLQIEAIEHKTPEHQYAKKMLLTNTLSLDKFDLSKLAKLTELTKEQVTAGLKFIKTLEFHPGRNFNSQRDLMMDPELYVRKVNSKWRVFLGDSILTRLEINKQYRTLIKQHSRDKAYKSVLNQLQEAQLLINGVKRRNETLLSVANYVVEMQNDFFEYGNKSLKSMTMAEVAEKLECHESTISRITTGKYIATPHGVFELKYFFPSHVKTATGDFKSSVAVKSMIEQLILKENPQQSYSDEQIALMLKEKDIHISRRTVAKYREAMNIPSSYLRAGMNIVKRKIEEEEGELVMG